MRILQANDVAELPTSTEVFKDLFELQWKIDSNEVTFLIKTKFKGWVGIGFGGSMTNTDMVIAQIVSNAFDVKVRELECFF